MSRVPAGCSVRACPSAGDGAHNRTAATPYMCDSINKYIRQSQEATTLLVMSYMTRGHTD